VFELSHSASGWTKKTLHSFGARHDGRYPYALLWRDASGTIYGTTAQYGSYWAFGVLFTYSSKGYTLPYDFNQTSGFYPQDLGHIVTDAAGNIYGTAADGGRWNQRNRLER
jgi:hypothetical protein